MPINLAIIKQIIGTSYLIEILLFQEHYSLVNFQVVSQIQVLRGFHLLRAPVNTLTLTSVIPTHVHDPSLCATLISIKLLSFLEKHFLQNIFSCDALHPYLTRHTLYIDED